jgi:hypothetical protein
MNKKEFGLIAAAIKTYYPNQNLMPNIQAMDLWYNQLKDIPYKECELALNKWVALNKWAPTIAEIRATVAEITAPEIPDWSEAWEEVMKNIQKYGFYRATEGKQALTAITRKTVERIGYIHLCNSENITADRANFRDIYNSIAQRERKHSLLPAVMQEAIEITRRSMLEMKGEKNE